MLINRMEMLLRIFTGILLCSLVRSANGQSSQLQIVGIAGKITKDSTSLMEGVVNFNFSFSLNRPDITERIFLVFNSRDSIQGEGKKFHLILPVVFKDEEYQLKYNEKYFPIKHQYGELNAAFKRDDLKNFDSIALYAQDRKGKYSAKQILSIQY